jgi:16S rRNA (cytidine1402-2'-O)-methyltransferase
MTRKKRQELPEKSEAYDPRGGVLYVVATPIGNLEDLTPRARRIFGEVDGVLCEDTRMTAKLLNAAAVARADGGSFEGRLARLDQHASEGRIDHVLGRLAAGENLALVSDAGTPAISDPGAEVVSRVAAAGFTVVSVPGASALTTFLAGAGFTEGSPIFRGFFPRKDGDRERELAAAASTPFAAVTIWFESPERLRESVAFLTARLPAARAVLAKELTKRHERFYYGSVSELGSHIHSAAADDEIRGEWVIGLAFAAKVEPLPENSGEWAQALRCLLNCGVAASQAAREVSQVFGISRNLVYPRALELAKARESAEE